MSEISLSSTHVTDCFRPSFYLLTRLRYARELAGGGDESAFADALFSLLPRLSCDWAPKASNARLAVECCELVLLKRKEYSVVRLRG